VTSVGRFAGLLLALAFAGAGPARAGMTADAVVTVELPGDAAIELGRFQAAVSLLPDGRIALAAAAFEASRTTLTPAPSTCFSPLRVEASGIRSGSVGVVGPPASGFGGRVALRGQMLAALFGVPLALPPTFDLDVGTPAVARRVLNWQTTRPSGVAVSASFSPWTTATVRLTSTVDGDVISQPTAVGSASTTASGLRHILMVSPVHVHHRDSHLVAGVRAEGKFRTHGLVARLSLAIPEPGAGIAQATVALALVALGRWRGRRRSPPGRVGRHA